MCDKRQQQTTTKTSTVTAKTKMSKERRTTEKKLARNKEKKQEINTFRWKYIYKVVHIFAPTTNGSNNKIICANANNRAVKYRKWKKISNFIFLFCYIVSSVIAFSSCVFLLMFFALLSSIQWILNTSKARGECYFIFPRWFCAIFPRLYLLFDDIGTHTCIRNDSKALFTFSLVASCHKHFLLISFAYSKPENSCCCWCLLMMIFPLMFSFIAVDATDVCHL